MSVRFFSAAIVAGVFTLSNLTFADEPSPLLVIHNGQFEPRELALPTGVKLKLVIRNQDDLPVEFESYDLSREIIVPPHSEAAIYVGPMQPGRYEFFNDFNHEMKGVIVAKPLAVKGN